MECERELRNISHRVDWVYEIVIAIRYATVHMELLVKLVVARDNHATVERLCALVFHTGRDAQTST